MSQLGENLQATARKENRWVWLALAAILVLYVFSALRVNPVATFGTSSDDALYFSSAKALAHGEGYILPSFPGGLRATKYPKLYPLLLAGVWKIDPHFPGNVKLAVALTLAFGCAALILIFLLLRRWPRVGDWPALAITILCAFSGYFLYLSACVRTEIPFTAVLLAAVWFAERRGRATGFAAGVATGLAVGLRSLGVAAVAGIGLLMLAKRQYRRLAWFSAAALPLALLWMWPAIGAILRLTGAHGTVSPGNSGWTQTLCYYTSYACGWKMDVGGAATLAAVVLKNLKGVVQGPGLSLLTPVVPGGRLWDLALVSLLGIASYAGIIRHVRRTGWNTLATIFAFYLLVIVPWPWTPERFLVTFLPLFYGGLWLEGRHFAGLVVGHLRPAHTTAERLTAGLCAVAGLAVVAAIAVNYVHAIPADVAAVAAGNEQLLAAERGAYAWIRRHARPGAPIVAYEDGLLYLYTGHPSVLPIMAHTQDFYLGKASYAASDAARLPDVARHIGAGYWLQTTRDYALTDPLAYRVLQKRQRQLLADTPVVFASPGGIVKLHDVRCLTGVKTAGCLGNGASDGEKDRKSGVAPGESARQP